MTKAFEALNGKIPGIVSFEYGVNDSPENLNKGFTHVYLLTFDDTGARDAYLPHPEHKKFVSLLGKLDVLAIPAQISFRPAMSGRNSSRHLVWTDPQGLSPATLQPGGEIC